MSRVRTQPPPDEVFQWDPPAGFHLERFLRDDARLATEEEHENRKCRRPGCQRKPVWALIRTRYGNGGRSNHWWLYCDWHTYGREITDEGVYSWRAVPDEESS